LFLNPIELRYKEKGKREISLAAQGDRLQEILSGKKYKRPGACLCSPLAGLFPTRQTQCPLVVE
jgi:hypothetical protein